MAILRHIFARSNAVDGHLGVELKAAEKFGRDEEVLAPASAVFTGGGAGNGDQACVDEAGVYVSCVVSFGAWERERGDQPFVARVHALVDLVDESERCTGETLQSHEIEDGRNSALAAGLTVVVEYG
jgi:hypothetical protein